MHKSHKSKGKHTNTQKMHKHRNHRNISQYTITEEINSERKNSQKTHTEIQSTESTQIYRKHTITDNTETYTKTSAKKKYRNKQRKLNIILNKENTKTHKTTEISQAQRDHTNRQKTFI